MENITTYDLCIVGGGIFGSAAARYATQNPSTKVCLVGPNEPTEEESKHREIFSSHYDEGRIVAYMSNRPVFNALAKCSIDRLYELEQLSGKRFFHPCGILKIMIQGTEFCNLPEKLKSCKIPCTDISEKGEFKNRFPFFKVDDNYAIFWGDTNGGYISARAYVNAQKQVAHNQGCDIIEGIVEDINGPNDGLHTVILSNRTILAKKVLFCTGAFTQFKAFNSLLQLKITLNKETAALVKISKNEADRLRSMPSVNYYKKTDYMPEGTSGAYILPPILYPDGEYYIKLGFLGTLDDSKIENLEDVNKWYNSCGSEELLNTMLKFLMEFIPGLKVEELKGMTCLTCNSPSGYPYIDRISPTVSVAVVGNGCGASVSDEVGRLAACMSLNGKWDSDLPKSLFEALFESEKV